MASVTDSAVSGEAAGLSEEVPGEPTGIEAVSGEPESAVRRSRRLLFGPVPVPVFLVLRWSVLAIQRVWQGGVTVPQNTWNITEYTREATRCDRRAR
jgi:hypothetical protein